MNRIRKKSPALYICMFVLWAGLCAALWSVLARGIAEPSFTGGEAPSKALRVIAIVLAALNGIFISYFWLNGVKDFIYVIWYHCAKKRLAKRYEPVLKTDVSGIKDKVLLLYCTCNDFDAASLAKSMRQNYAFFETVILDDSSDPKYVAAVNEFASRHSVRVVRREDRSGFKAGNINHFLTSDEAVQSDYKYAVILDSDEVIPADFINECLKYFLSYDNIGIVQANHIATRNRNFFMNLFHIGVNSHWHTYQTMKNFYGFTSMLGHGAMIRRECYEAAGGFPPLVAEDLCLSIEMRNRGYTVVFAPNIVCEEEYPADYAAFKKRHSKWTQGNLEFIKKYTGKIVKSKIPWFEKADIVLFTYNLPLTAVFGFYIFLNIMLMPALGMDIGQMYPVWMLVPTVFFFFSPMLNDVFVWLFRINIFKFLFYQVSVIVLYGSMLFTSLASAVLGMFGRKAKFIVTPKNAGKTGFLAALRIQYKELIFSAALAAVSLIFCKSVLPVILIVATGGLSFFLLFFANRKYGDEKTKSVDAVTARISLSQNALARKQAEPQSAAEKAA